ncbi:hypothetical protein [Cytobacillus horneckiae]|uniref:hypothetical protein n=1 Tax=Cytobacillus horneckiae TaxID=549687 RepID=UPI003D9A2A8F
MPANKRFVPPLYLNSPDDSNQTVYRLHYLYEILEKQNRFNHEIIENFEEVDHRLNESFHQVEQLFANASSKQQNEFELFNQKLHTQDGRIAALVDSVYANQEKQQKLLSQLSQLKEANSDILNTIEEESQIHQEILAQMNYQDAAVQDISRKLDRFDETTEKIIDQMNEHEQISKEIKLQSDAHEIYHQTVMERMNQQDALSEKIIRQLEHLKSVIYERAVFLGEHIKTVVKPVKSFFLHHEEKEQ